MQASCAAYRTFNSLKFHKQNQLSCLPESTRMKKCFNSNVVAFVNSLVKFSMFWGFVEQFGGFLLLLLFQNNLALTRIVLAGNLSTRGREMVPPRTS